MKMRARNVCVATLVLTSISGSLVAAGPAQNAVDNYPSRPVSIVAGLQEARDAMHQRGAEIVYTTPEAFDKFQRVEIVKWRKVIREAKIQEH